VPKNLDKPKDADRYRPLMDRPQRLGIWPTASFWKAPDVRANPIVRRLLIPAQAVLVVSLFMAWSLVFSRLLHAATGLGPGGRVVLAAIFGGILGGGSACLTFGLFERHLRRAILERRREYLAAIAVRGE
jgi:hypothetical protein